MSFVMDSGFQLLTAAKEGNIRVAKAALAAGANVNGSPSQPMAPIVGATMADNVDMIDFLLEQGADPDGCVRENVPYPSFGIAHTTPGERALHIAAKQGNVEIVCLLLTRARADPNTTDRDGCTPLFSACERPHVYVEMVRSLFEAGADPALSAGNGYTPLHMAAHRDHIDLVGMLHAGAPAALNRRTTKGYTPLFVACAKGHEGIVSKLLSLGARQRVPLTKSDMCPLAIAISHGFVGVVRVLAKEGGKRAVGGEEAVIGALGMTVQNRQVGSLRLLLREDGEKKRLKRANTNIEGLRLLHHGAAFCHPAAVRVLIEAGADETARRDGTGLEGPREVIGVDIGLEDQPQMDRGKAVAIRRMLQRGPAYRARSWAWPSDAESDAGGRDAGDTVVAAGADVLSSPPAVKTPPVVGVRIFRPKENSRKKIFVRLIGRYCAKN